MAATHPSTYRGLERRAASKIYAGPERRSSGALVAGGMDSHAKLFGHPLHQQLVAFPVGLLATSVVFDLIYLYGGSPTMATVSFWMLLAGLLGAALATPFGYIDWLAIPEHTRAKRIGTMHGIGNVGALALFAFSALIRINDSAQPPGLAIGLSIAGGVLVALTAWLGGELVSRLGVGVSPQAGLDAPNSLRD